MLKKSNGSAEAATWSSIGVRLLVMTVGVALTLGVGLTRNTASAADPIRTDRPSVVQTSAAPAAIALENRHIEHKVLPAIVVAAVWLIVRFGYWVVRYAPQVMQVFNNYLMKRAACQELRRQGNSWGWSFICWGT